MAQGTQCCSQYIPHTTSWLRYAGHSSSPPPCGGTHATHGSLDYIYRGSARYIYIYRNHDQNIYIRTTGYIYTHRSLIDRYGRPACMLLLPCSVSGFGADKPRPVFVGCLWALGSIRSSCGDAQPSELLSFSLHILKPNWCRRGE